MTPHWRLFGRIRLRSASLSSCPSPAPIRIRRPVYFGENGIPSLAYEIDGFHPGWRCGIEIEAGRGWKGNGVYRDLFQPLIMVNVDHLVLAVANSYKYKSSGTLTVSRDHRPETGGEGDEASENRGDEAELRLHLHALAYNLGNFLRMLALPKAVEQWSLTSLREKLIKIGAKIARHGRYVTFQMAEVAVPKPLFADILRLIAELRPPPDPAPA